MVLQPVVDLLFPAVESGEVDRALGAFRASEWHRGHAHSG